MAGKTLYDKIWDQHVVRQHGAGAALLYVDRHMVHEVTSPQAFEGLRLAGRRPWRTGSILATADHNVPTTRHEGPIEDPLARTQVDTLERNGFTPVARLPRLPHSICKLAVDRTLSTPVVCCVMPIE